MSDLGEWDAEAQPQALQVAQSPGALLHQARVAAGVHIESIAFSLKVPVSKIDALERDDFASLPDAVFVRALASSVCRTLKMDARPVLDLVPQGVERPLSLPDTRAGTSFSTAQMGRAPAWWGRMSKPVALGVVALLVAASAVAWLPDLQRWIPESGSADATPNSQVTSGPAAVESGAESLASGTGAPIAAPLNAKVDGPNTESAPSVSPALPLAQVASDKPLPRLAFEAKGESWIQVKDGQGAVILERILRAGERAVVDHAGRLQVVVGRADATDVLVLGEKRDLTAVARENVARFEVNP